MTFTPVAPIVSARLRAHEDSHTLPRAVTTGAYRSLRTALGQTPEQVHETVKTAVLQGRGGAGFPAGAKWGLLPGAKYPRWLVVNGDESEPGTYKDRLLMERDPHQVIEGALICAYAIRASQVFLYVRGEMALAQERMAEALNDAYAAGYVGHNICGSSWSMDITLHWGAGAYIVGDETALLESLAGRRGMPLPKPPYFPAAIGLYGDPTIVNNIETLSNLPWIIANGGEAFAALGSEKTNGTRMFALSGHVKKPGIYEVESGKVTFRDMFYDPQLGGGIRANRRVKAFIPGGGSAPWFFEEHLDLALDPSIVGPAGSMLGSGAIVVMDETTDMVRAAWRLVRFYANESCGKCTPCREGASWLERIYRRILDGEGRMEDLDLLADVGSNISPGPFPGPGLHAGDAPIAPFPYKKTTICDLGPSTVSPVMSSLRRFRNEYEAYILGARPTERQPMADQIKLTVDGREIDAVKGELVIVAAERAGVYIPRFCYHPRMRAVGMCRMCLVDVDTGRGPALTAACIAEVGDGMVVDTTSPGVKKAQDGVLEFLLINHPLDCPVCDKGGECPLQDQTLHFGPGETRFVEEKRHYEKPIAISDLVLLDRERCILCDRCTRFSAEVVGDPLIQFIDRGNETQVNTFPDHPFASYFSGNVVQLCPVGALTSTPYRFTARPWDIERVESTCTTCAVGCRIAIESSSNVITRYQGLDSEPVNHTWLCDRGRFDFGWINAEDRLTAPLVRKGDELVEASWGEALGAAASELRDVLTKQGPDAIGVIGGARLTNEDCYAWAKLTKGIIGTDNVDAQLGDGLPGDVVLGLPQATIDEACTADAVIVIGPDLKEELPVLFLRLRGAIVDDGLKVVEVTSRVTSLTALAAASLVHRPGEAGEVAAALVADAEPPGDVSGGPGSAVTAARKVLGNAARVVVIIGRQSVAESPRGVVAAAGVLHAALPGAAFLVALRRGNVRGALDLGLAPGLLPGRVTLDAGREWYATHWHSVPETSGLDTAGILAAAAEGRIHSLVLLGADPLSDFPDRELARRALTSASSVIAVDTVLTESSCHATVVLAAAAYGEKGGTTTNLEGRVTRLAQKIVARGSAWADWMIASELAAQMGADLGLESLDQVWDEIQRVAPAHRGLTRALLRAPARVDGIVVPPTDDPAAGATTAAEVTARDPMAAYAPPTVVDGSSGSLGLRVKGWSITPAIDGAPILNAELPQETTFTEPGPDPEEEPVAGDAVPSPVAPPEPLTWEAPAERPSAPKLDAYSMRLVSGRVLYDQAASVTRTPHLASLVAATPPARINPAELARLGVPTGGQVRMTSARMAVTLPVVADANVPKGTVALTFNLGSPGAADLIDATADVTEVRVETT